jgi:hypothetical protein
LLCRAKDVDGGTSPAMTAELDDYGYGAS